MNKATKIVTAIGVVILAIALFVLFMRLPGPGPLVIGEEVHADAQHQCPQTTDHTCGPASCVSILSWLGIDSTEREMARLCKTTPSGTDFQNEQKGLEIKTGHSWRYLKDVPATPSVGMLIVVDVLMDGTAAASKDHSICARWDGTGWLVNNPDHEKPEWWTARHLAGDWVQGVTPSW